MCYRKVTERLNGSRRYVIVTFGFFDFPKERQISVKMTFHKILKYQAYQVIRSQERINVELSEDKNFSRRKEASWLASHTGLVSSKSKILNGPAANFCVRDLILMVRSTMVVIKSFGSRYSRRKTIEEMKVKEVGVVK